MMMCVGGEGRMYRGWTVTELGTGHSREGRPTLGLLFTHSKNCMNSAGRGHGPQKTLLSTIRPLNL